ncbi:MAG: RidA family protein [Phycisphaerales bacterium]|nr:RidA family protein [Phycisphaerales bacterium]
MSRIEAKLSSLGVDLPDPPAPVAAYVPVRVVGDLAYVSGQIPMIRGKIMAKGPVPSIVSPEDAAQAARLCAINGLAALRQSLGDLDRIKGIVRLGVFVASDAGFTGQPAVANGASEFLVEIFGEAGRHVRAAVGSVSLPLGVTVEVEMTVECSQVP